ncbi:MAG: DNA polymerase III subunit beta [Parcubacteria group bacterium]
MKIECIKDKFSEAVGKVEKIAGRNPTLPVLSGIYFKASKKGLLIKSTNLDLGITLTLPVKVVEEGEVIVPAQVLHSFLSSLPPDKNITLSHNGNTLEVKTSFAKTTIKTLPLDEFPQIVEIPDDLVFTLPARDLATGLKAVAYAASPGSMKPELGSILVSYNEGELVFAATDSFRLGEKRLKIKKIPHFKQLLIPQKNALEIIRLFDRESEEISLSVGEHQVAFRKEGFYLVSRIIEGTFPDYKQIIPKDFTGRAIILKEDLLSALKTNLVFADSFNQLTINLSPSKKIFEIDSKNTNVGENISKVEAALEGEDVSINVNHRYLTDCFQAISADSISLSFNGPAKPIVVEGVGDKSFKYLVMPMNRS